MLEFLTNKAKTKIKPIEKILLTLFILFLFRLGNTLPILGVDQESLKSALLQLNKNNTLMQMVNMYSAGNSKILTPFSLGIVPFINASIIVDLLTALFPAFEKLQSEEGESGRKKLSFYKKALAFVFAGIQSFFLINTLKTYFYNQDFFHLGSAGLELVVGSMIIIWLSTILDKKGIGNGTSLIILTNIITTLIGKESLLFNNWANAFFIIEIGFLLILIGFICISQTARITIDVVSARQLVFLENNKKTFINNKNNNLFQLKESGLSIRLNQAGIFPIIIASNILPFISYLTQNLFGQEKIFETIIYYALIVIFNYFYTIIFWDPEKISEQLRKASVSIVNVAPGQETISYLENVVRSTSIIGGLFLCGILFCYDLIKQYINGPLLNQLNISSLIIVVGVSYEIQKTIRSLYKNNVN